MRSVPRLPCTGWLLALILGGAMACGSDDKGSGSHDTEGTPRSCASDAECDPINPLCDTGTGQCGGCSSTADCAALGTDVVCDTSTGACVECTASEGCDAEDQCDLALHECTAGCSVDADCPEDEPICDSARGLCVECSTDEDCGDERCAATTQTCVECTTDADCPESTPVCAPDGECSVTCSTDADCGAVDGFCDTAAGVCYECVVHEHCGDGGFCQADHSCGGESEQ